MSVKTKFARNLPEAVVWLLVAPAVIISLTNADVFRLVIGAFGPPQDVAMFRVLLLGLAVGAIALWRLRRSGSERRTSRWRIMSLGLAAIISIAVVVVRGSDLRRRNVAFRGNGIRIAATIYEPRAPGRYPAVVFAGGSAPFKRGLYSLWAEHLAKKGIIAIVPDKRGVGGTGGEFERKNNTSKANLDLLAGDAIAALRFAAHQPNVDSLRLGLFGISQGGWTVPMAAISTPLARFMVVVTGPSVSVREEGAWSDLMGDDVRAAKLTRAEAERVIDTVAAGGVDARSRLALLSTPGLWLFGSDDASIPTRKSVAVLDSLNRTLGKQFSYFVAPGCGHLVLCRDTGILPKVAPSAWKALDDWLAQAVR